MHLEFVPQVYNDEYAEAEGWASNSEKAIAAGVEYFMYFGEPKAEGISVERAVDVWMDKFEPYSKRGVKLGAPGNLQNDGDFEWQEEFLKQCAARGCTIDFVCVHWMWSAEQIESFKEVITRATTLAGKYGNKQVWVDNFFAEGTYDAQIAFLKEAIPWLETNPKIDRYAYVGLDRPLKDKEGRDSGGFFPPDENSYELTELGRFYASYEG